MCVNIKGACFSSWHDSDVLNSHEIRCTLHVTFFRLAPPFVFLLWTEENKHDTTVSYYRALTWKIHKKTNEINDKK